MEKQYDPLIAAKAAQGSWEEQKMYHCDNNLGVDIIWSSLPNILLGHLSLRASSN